MCGNDKATRRRREQRAAWIAANPRLWARLLRFLTWLLGQIGVKSDYTAMLKSIPPNGNVPQTAPPVPGASTAPPAPAAPVAAMSLPGAA